MNDLILGNANQCTCKVGHFDKDCPHATEAEVIWDEERHAMIERSEKAQEPKGLKDGNMGGTF